LQERLIKNYIKKMTINDIKDFLNKEKLEYDNNDINILFVYIKNNYENIINNPIDVMTNIKSEVSKKTFNTILILYNKYKDKINLLKK